MPVPSAQPPSLDHHDSRLAPAPFHGRLMVRRMGQSAGRFAHLCLASTLALALGLPGLALAETTPRAAQKPTQAADDKGHDLGARWVGVLRPSIAEDENPDPKTVEVTLVARAAEVAFRPGGPTSSVWTINGQMPAPAIEANLGDRLIVHLENELPEAIALHWHGLTVPAAMDGSVLSQEPVPPGGTFRYEFLLDRAGTFWYHPGAQVLGSEQLGRRAVGLKGALRVSAPWAEDEVLELPIWDHLLVLDDVVLDSSGTLASAPSDPLERAEIAANGLEGNAVLLNGRQQGQGSILGGRPHRLRLINASNGSFARFGIDGHGFWRLGGDAGLLPSPLEIPPVTTDPITGESQGGVLLAPGERADVAFVPQDPVLFLRWHDVARGRQSARPSDDDQVELVPATDDGRRRARLLATLRVLNLKADAGTKLYGPPDWPYLDETWEPRQVLRPLAPLVLDDLPALAFELGATSPDAQGEIAFYAQTRDGVGLPFEAVTVGDAPTAMAGEVRVVEIRNTTASDEAFHIHGFRARLLETEWVDLDTPANNRITMPAQQEEKDTVWIPRRPGARERSWTVVRLAISFDGEGRSIEAFGKVPGLESESGGWLLTSSIAEHGARGMASFVQVLEPPLP